MSQSFYFVMIILFSFKVVKGVDPPVKLVINGIQWMYFLVTFYIT